MITDQPQSPCGSSTGSAVGVSAGYSRVSLGSDSIGSLVSSVTRAALYIIKPTVGGVDMSGLWAVSSHKDIIEGLIKSVIDLTTVTTALMKSDTTRRFPEKGFEEYFSDTFQRLRIDFLDPREWHFSSKLCKEIDAVTEQIVSNLSFIRLSSDLIR